MITVILIFLLKTTGLLNLVLKAFRADDNKIIGDSDNRANKTVVNLSKNNKSKNLMYILNIRAINKSTFLTSNIKKIFNYLKQI